MSADPDPMPVPRKTPLSSERVFAAAVEIADAEGIEALSMRRLAGALGVKAMSLYNHVAGKEVLLDGMAEAVIAEIERPAAGGDWRNEMRRRAHSARAALLRHPWAAMVILSRANPGPATLAYVEATLACLAGAGFSYPMADHIWHAIDSHVFGFTLQELQFPFRPETYAEEAGAYLPFLADGRLPHLRAMTELVARRAHDGIQDFDFGLGLLIDGLERMRAAA